jgi:DNA-binding NtrC family response regulator/tetratricopeptide (TPR) repeat protein
MTQPQRPLGTNTAIAAILKNLERLTPTLERGHRTPPILLQGETGTGKGLLARLIHHQSPRASGPFIDLNCAAIPPALLEAELFGYERGAFTDARQAKTGLVQAAHSGTLFLDEVGLLPESLQAKLLTAVETREVRPLGSTTTRPVDVLIIAATNADLAVAVREGRFREDLYHRLAVLTFSLPPLRERSSDIRELADEFLARACVDHGLPPKRLSADAHAALGRYPWPGNVRELANAMERVALLTDGSAITAADLRLPAVRSPGNSEMASDAQAPLRASLESFTRARVEEAVRLAGGNVSAAADHLGLPRSTLRYHLSRLGLIPSGRSRKRGPSPAKERDSLAAPAAAPPDTGSASVRWERRHVALLRAVITRSTDTPTALSGTWDLQFLVDKTKSLDGRVVGVMANGILAAFGLDPLEEAPSLAAHAGIAMCREIERAHGQEAQGPTLRVALHVVPALVGRIGGDAHIDHDAKREAAALLDTLIGRGDPGTVAASEAALPFLSRRHRLEPIPATSAAAIPAYRVFGLGFAGPVSHALTPFVGRERELGTLQALLTRTEDHAQRVSIAGEPGIGKSRLLHEFRRRLENRDLVWLEGHCASYGSDMPYFAVATLLRQAFGILETDHAKAIVEKIERHLTGIGMDPGESAADLLRVLGVAEHAGGTEPNPKAVQARTFDNVRRLLLHTARAHPTVVVVEDVHWIDRGSGLCFESLVKSLAGAPILFVATARPGSRSPWADDTPSAQIALPRLAHDETLSLVAAILRDPAIPESVTRVILRRAEGNPLFLEELARSAQEHGQVPGPADVPGTIGQVVQARIDRLPGDLRGLLNTAAVLGGNFPAALLEMVSTEEPRTVRASARELVRLDFLEESGGLEGTAYAFRHALFQEVTYAGLTGAERREIHRRAGRALETRHAGRLSEAYDRLAYHYARSGETGQAVEYLTRLARQAAQAHARAEAVTALHEAMSQVERLPSGPERDRLFTNLILRQRDALYFLGDLRRGTLDFLLRQRQWVDRLEARPVRSLYYLWLGRISTPLGEFALASESGKRAVAEAQASGDELTAAAAWTVLAHACCWTGQVIEGIEHGRRAVDRLEATAERYWLGYAYRGLALNCLELGDVAAGAQAARRLGELGDELGESFFQFSAAWLQALVPLVLGDLDEAITACRRVLETAPSPFEIAQASTLLAMTYVEVGEAEKAIDLLEPLAAQGDRLRQRHVQGMCMASLGEAHRLRGDLERAQKVALEAASVTAETGYRWGTGLAHRVLGQIAMDRGHLEEAQAELVRAAETFSAIPARYELGRTQLVLGEVMARMRDLPAAAKSFHAALSLFEALAIPRYAEKAREALGAVEPS